MIERRHSSWDMEEEYHFKRFKREHRLVDHLLLFFDFFLNIGNILSLVYT